MMDRNKLAIFDMDGTLFDTKNVNFNAYKQALDECGLNVNIDYDYYCKFCNGNNYKVFLPVISPEITIEQMEYVHDRKKQLYPQYLKNARINKNLFTLINLIKNEYQIALVTTASKKNLNDILDFFKIRNTFDFILTQEDVKNTKPNPEGFLVAMNRAGVSRKNTLIFEDSDTGIEAAEKTGADYVRVYGYN